MPARTPRASHSTAPLSRGTPPFRSPIRLPYPVVGWVVSRVPSDAPLGNVGGTRAGFPHAPGEQSHEGEGDMRESDGQRRGQDSDLTIRTTDDDSPAAEQGEGQVHGDDHAPRPEGTDPQSERESGEVVGWFGLVPGRWREVIGFPLTAEALSLLTLRVGALVSPEEVNWLEKRSRSSSTPYSLCPETGAARGRSR